MSDVQIITGVVFEDSGATCLARITGQDGANITQASLSAIDCKIIDPNSPSASIYPDPDVTIASAVFDTLQTDERWSLDDDGYNFRFTVAASYLASANRIYLVNFKFTPVSGEVFYVKFRITTLPLEWPAEAVP